MDRTTDPSFVSELISFLRLSSTMTYWTLE